MVAIVVDDVEFARLIVIACDFPKATFTSNAVSATTELDFQLMNHLSCFVVEKSGLIEFDFHGCFVFHIFNIPGG